MLVAKHIQEVSHQGDKIILRSKNSIKADRCPLGGGGIVEGTGRGILASAKEGDGGD